MSDGSPVHPAQTDVYVAVKHTSKRAAQHASGGCNGIAWLTWLEQTQAIVNRFAPPSKRGAVNGTAQSLASGVRALGPFLGGLMWAVFSGLPGPGCQLIPFFIISLTAAGTITIYYFLPAI